MKIDLHLHSNKSTRPSQWVLQKIGCPESFSEPEFLHGLLKRKGLSAFTLTDHNTIEGCLEVAHLENTFISEEVTTYFPEDGCKVHVLVYDIDESIHREIQKVRANVFDLVAYLNRAGIIHAVAHPLFSINDRLTPDHFEQFLLLFKTFELNGARDDFQNKVLREILDNLTRTRVERLADKHGLEPTHAEPWEKRLIAGSDDHSSLNAGRMYTQVAQARDLKGFLAGLAEGRTEPRGRGSEPRTLAHNLYGIAYQYYSSRMPLARYAKKDVLMSFLERSLGPENGTQANLLVRLRGLWGQRRTEAAARTDRFEEVIRREAQRMVLGDKELMKIVNTGRAPDRDPDLCWAGFVNRITNRVLHHFSTNLFNRLEGGNLFTIFDSLGSAGTLYLMTAPYFISYGLFARDRNLSRRIQSGFSRPRDWAGEEIKVAHFTDTFFEINGVALTLQQNLRTALAQGKELTILTSTDRAGSVPKGVRNFKPITQRDLPEYPELKLTIPPILEMMDYLYQGGFTTLHSATPGPMGLAALALARILHLPISGTYHTAIPQYAAHLTEDISVEHLTWRFTLWYYSQMDYVYVPSRAIGDELIEKGLEPSKIILYPRGVNTTRFSPGRPDPEFVERHGLGSGVRLLYVGRVSREKNLPLLMDSFEDLHRENPETELIVAGDGPYLEEMRGRAQGLPVRFTGYLTGDELPAIYRCADLFVFPSTTDTFGNVVLEAQAAGLPTIVTDRGGPHENVLPGQTGLIVPADDREGLTRALAELVRDPLRRRKMSRQATEYMADRSIEASFEEMWRRYGQNGPDGGEEYALAV